MRPSCDFVVTYLLACPSRLHFHSMRVLSPAFNYHAFRVIHRWFVPRSTGTPQELRPCFTAYAVTQVHVWPEGREGCRGEDARSGLCCYALSVTLLTRGLRARPLLGACVPQLSPDALLLAVRLFACAVWLSPCNVRPCSNTVVG